MVEQPWFKGRMVGTAASWCAKACQVQTKKPTENPSSAFFMKRSADSRTRIHRPKPLLVLEPVDHRQESFFLVGDHILGAGHLDEDRRAIGQFEDGA